MGSLPASRSASSGRTAAVQARVRAGGPIGSPTVGGTSRRLEVQVSVGRSTDAVGAKPRHRKLTRIGAAPDLLDVPSAIRRDLDAAVGAGVKDARAWAQGHPSGSAR